jgi:methionyl-tRNA formyltransferase
MASNLRIVFMGTPEFAVASLDILVLNGYSIVGVVTAPDKPAGRGLELSVSDVKKYALEKGLNILQPVKLKEDQFLNELRSLRADLQVVVAFRMLPEVVWNMPHLGTINLHGSLLPHYRGAAPINRAVMNGESQTGVSTFFLQQEVDTGKIIFQRTTLIGENESAGDVHDRMMVLGAELVLETVRAIESGNYPQIDQTSRIPAGEPIKTAPKIFKEDCRISWNTSEVQVHNFIRGLSPYPGAHTELLSPQGKRFPIKIFRASRSGDPGGGTPGKVYTDGKTFLQISTSGGSIRAEEVQLAGKRKMNTTEFLRGFPLSQGWTVAES